MIKKISNELNSKAVLDRLNESDKLIESLSEQIKKSSEEIENAASKSDMDSLKQKLTSTLARMDEIENGK